MFGLSRRKTVRLSHTVKCAGCAAKLSPVLLREALATLPPSSHPDLLIGPQTLDDAAVFKLSGDLVLIHTADFFPPIVDDPYLFGQIAASNAMSDVYAMGAEVTTALNLISFPKTLSLDILCAILKGAADKVNEAGATVAGGHTVATETLLFGQAVTGICNREAITSNAQAQPGQRLILAKAIGTGVITTAIKKDLIKDREGLEAYASMTQLNRKAAQIMRRHGVRSATDVTGFGLLGHGFQMASASKVTFTIEACRVPLLEGALDLARRKVATGALRSNREYVASSIEKKGAEVLGLEDLLLDPQTSGGLLIAAEENTADRICGELVDAGYAKASIIGYVTQAGAKPVRVVYD